MFASHRTKLIAISTVFTGFLVISINWVYGQEGKQLITYKDAKQEMDQTFKERNDLINGVRPPEGPKDQKIMDIAAKWYILRVTLSARQEANPNEMAEYHQDLETKLVRPLLSTNAA